MELLVVMAIIGVLIALVIPAFNTINRGGDVTKAGYDVSGVLQTARSYATANDTYVWVGFFEENINVSGTSGIGKIVISTVASADGTMVYTPNSVTTMTSGLTQLDKLVKISNMHLKTAVANDPVFPVGSGTGTSFDARPAVGGTNAQIGDIPSDASLALNLFQYPPGGTAQYKFKKTIQFNPRGEAAVIVNNVVQPLTPIIEVGLQSTHGNVVDNISRNVSAVQVTGVGGNVAIYRR